MPLKLRLPMMRSACFAVGVQRQDGVVAALDRGGEAAAQRRAFALVRFLAQHLRPGAGGELAGAVAGAVVHHQHGQLRARALHDAHDAVALVVGGNDRQDAGRAHFMAAAN
jgi:hypothetical protein